MKTPERKNTTKKLHPFPENALEKASWRSDESKTKLIAKYALRDVQLIWLRHFNDAQSTNAIKRVKRIRIIRELSSYKPPSSQWRLILQNKFKSIRTYYPNRKLLKSIKFFQR